MRRVLEDVAMDTVRTLLRRRRSGVRGWLRSLEYWGSGYCSEIISVRGDEGAVGG